MPEDISVRRANPDLQQQRIEEIVAAATACFLEKGFHKTSVQDIAGRAGLSMGLLYRYFPSKEAIIEAAATTAGRQALEHIEQFAQATELVDGVRQLALALIAAAAIPGYQALLAEVHAESFRSPALRRMEQQDLAAMRQAVSAALRQHQQAGRLHAGVDTLALATVILAAIEGLSVHFELDPTLSAQLQQRTIDVLTSLLLGVRSPL